MSHKTIQFGEHLTIDGYNGNKDKLDDKDLVLQTLSELPEKLGMKKLAEPVIYRSEGNNIKDPGGWTGVVIIEESHISIHTFTRRGFLTADVYTCKAGMDIDFIINYFTERFEFEFIEKNLLNRGMHYPADDLE